MLASGLSPLALASRQLLYFKLPFLPNVLRSFSSISCAGSSGNAKVALSLPTRWLTDLRRRIGKCILYGLEKEQVDEAANILKVVARDWRELVVGSEGFLTRAGFEGRDVVWGEMVSCKPHDQYIMSGR